MRRGNLQDFGANVMYEISNDGKQTRRKYTMKLGLSTGIGSEWFIDLVNILSECKYVV